MVTNRPCSFHGKLKLPEKALYALILIMVIVQVQCTSSGQLCFDKVWKTKMYNVDNAGYLSINRTNKQIFLKKAEPFPYVYKISANAPASAPHIKLSFYLFDPHTRRFLCWKTANGSMITMNYETMRKRDHQDYCKFVEVLTEDSRYGGYSVQLQLAGHPGTRMQFNRKGRTVSQKRVEKCAQILKLQQQQHQQSSHKGGVHKRRLRRCQTFDKYFDNGDKEGDCCAEAQKTLCQSKTAQMPELKSTCTLIMSCKNVVHRNNRLGGR